MTGERLLDVRSVGRRFGYRPVFADLSLTLDPGQIVTVIGPNGAGKTTLLRVLAGLVKPTTGAVVRHGRVGLLSHQSMLYDALTAAENLDFYAQLAGRVPSGRVDELLERVGLLTRRDERVRTFSQGMVQRLALARTLLADPAVLLLDEPTSNLDEPGCQLVLELLQELRDRGRACLIVTHQYERVATVTTSVGFLVGGRLHGPDPSRDHPPAVVAERYHRLLMSDA